MKKKMSNLPFKKFKRQLTERRYSGPERGDEYKKLSPTMKGAIDDIYTTLDNTPDPLVNKIEGIIEIDNQIANEIKTGVIAAPQGEDMETDNENPDINIGDE